MTQHFGFQRPRFFLTEVQPCPYLPGRTERKVFTPLRGAFAAEVNDELSAAGFRRSQNVAYRPQCIGCSACVSSRLLAAEFTPNRTQRKTLRRNARLTRALCPAIATHEQYDLFSLYLGARHHDGAMAAMDTMDFAAMVEDTTVRTQIIEYRDPGRDNALVAVALTDVMQDGLSMVYSFFDPALSRESLGSFMIMDHAALAAEIGLRHVYLGYRVEGCRKMAYKTDFRPLEVLTERGWVLHGADG